MTVTAGSPFPGSLPARSHQGISTRSASVLPPFPCAFYFQGQSCVTIGSDPSSWVRWEEGQTGSSIHSWDQNFLP